MPKAIGGSRHDWKRSPLSPKAIVGILHGWNGRPPYSDGGRGPYRRNAPVAARRGEGCWGGGGRASSPYYVVRAGRGAGAGYLVWPRPQYREGERPPPPLYPSPLPAATRIDRDEHPLSRRFIGGIDMTGMGSPLFPKASGGSRHDWKRTKQRGRRFPGGRLVGCRIVKESPTRGGASAEAPDRQARAPRWKAPGRASKWHWPESRSRGSWRQRNWSTTETLYPSRCSFSR